MLNIYDESTLQEIKCDFIWLVLHVIRKAVRPNYIQTYGADFGQKTCAIYRSRL